MEPTRAPAAGEALPPDELAELEQIFAVAHGPEPTEAQRAAAAGWDTLLAKDYAPRPTISVPAHPVTRAKYPVIDVHKHLGYSPRRGWPADVEQLVEGMDRLNIRAFVNLDGLSGVHLRRVLDRYAKYPNRFLTFAGPSWHRGAEPDFGQREARDLEASVKAGARGYKLFKALGLWLRDPAGKLYLPDDPRLDPIWQAAAELRVPVLIHVADPQSFFLPPDRHNDRLPSLGRRPEWYFGTDNEHSRSERCVSQGVRGTAGQGEFPSFEALMESQVALFKKHPRTTFFAAHVMNRPDDLAWVGQVVEQCPNVYPEISARISDLGRQPRTARAFFEKYQDRVLFGTDGSDLGSHAMYFRVLETEDDLIIPTGGGRGAGADQERGTLRAGSAPLYGLGLPDPVLRKLYQDNAARIFGMTGA